MALKGPQKSLRDWTKQDWDYINSSDKSKPRAQRGRYLPKSVRESLTPYQRAQENKKKRQASKRGKQNAPYSRNVARKVRRAS
jgi:hypothetical protein